MGTDKRERQRANRQQKQVEQARVDRRRHVTRRAVIGALVVAALFVLVLVLAIVVGGDDDDDDDDVPPAPAATSVPEATPTSAAVASGSGAAGESRGRPAAFDYGTGDCPPDTVDEPVREFAGAPRLCIDPARTYTATFVTSEGDIVVELHADEQPGTVNNFVTLARFGYYDDTVIFRAEPASGLFQGGGLDNSSSPGYTIPDEGSGFTYEPGTLAMARTAQPDSAGAQWFFTTDESASYLDQYGTFVVFGHVVDGLDVARDITALGDSAGVPRREVRVETVEITED